MLPNSVSRRFVRFAAMPAMLFLAIPFLGPMILFPALRPDPWVVLIVGPLFYFYSEFLLLKALSHAGIPVRSRMVERFQTDHRDEKELAADLPILVRYNQLAIWVAAGIIILLGLGLCSSTLWIPGLILIGIGLITSLSKQPKICEINDKGIRSRAGFWNRFKLVPWVELARCEIVHDDENAWVDYFLLWDRFGRCRLDARSWIVDVSPADRARIFRALRFRFPGKAKGDSPAEPALVGAASSTVWDRELDG